MDADDSIPAAASRQANTSTREIAPFSGPSGGSPNFARSQREAIPRAQRVAARRIAVGEHSKTVNAKRRNVESLVEKPGAPVRLSPLSEAATVNDAPGSNSGNGARIDLLDWARYRP
jgi:hypothetical protein